MRSSVAQFQFNNGQPNQGDLNLNDVSKYLNQIPKLK